MHPKKNKSKHVKFYLFLATAGKEGMALMGSGLASFIGGVVQNVRGSSLSSLGLVILAVLLFGWGAYITWSREHTKLQEEEAKNGKPEIKIRLLGALHHVIALDNTLYLGPSFVTVHIGLVNVRHAPTTIKGYGLKIFLGRGEFTGTLVPSNVRFSIAKEKVLEHKGVEKTIRVRKKLDVEMIIPLDDTITHSDPLVYMLEQKGYLHFIVDMPVYKYEMEENAKAPAEFTIALTLTDPQDGVHMGRFEKIAIEPANLRIIGTEGEKSLRQEEPE
jgi:hypothetical protein